MPLLPPAIKSDATIGYFSSSSPATATAPRRYQRARAYLKAQGYQLVSGQLAGQQDFYRSGTIHARAAELNALIRDPKIDVVMATIGGSNSNALLPYLDYEALRARPKVIIGYSDVTSILLAIYQRAGLVTFYGPALVSTFGEFEPLVGHSHECFRALLSGGGHAPYRYTLPEEWSDERLDWESQERAKRCQPNRCIFHGAGSVEGRIIGGNLNTMWSLWGSPYMPEIREGDILLLEDSYKNIATVERLFMFLRLNGIFDRVSAILLGKHEQFDDQGSGRSPFDVLQEVLDGQLLPIVEGFDACHTHPILTVPLGVRGRIDFDHGQVELIEACLSE